MRIDICSLTFNAIIGILDHERTTAQRIVIDAALEYDFRGGFIDYADAAEHIKTIMIQEKFELIEEALLMLKKRLKASYPAIETLSLKITKPDILPDCEVSVSETYKF